MKIHYIEQIGEIVKEICVDINKEAFDDKHLLELIDDIKSRVKITDTDIDNYTKQFLGKISDKEKFEDGDEDDGEAWKRSVN